MWLLQLLNFNLFSSEPVSFDYATLALQLHSVCEARAWATVTDKHLIDYNKLCVWEGVVQMLENYEEKVEYTCT